MLPALLKTLPSDAPPAGGAHPGMEPKAASTGADAGAAPTFADALLALDEATLPAKALTGAVKIDEETERSDTEGDAPAMGDMTLLIEPATSVPSASEPSVKVSAPPKIEFEGLMAVPVPALGAGTTAGEQVPSTPLPATFADRVVGPKTAVQTVTVEPRHGPSANTAAPVMTVPQAAASDPTTGNSMAQASSPLAAPVLTSPHKQPVIPLQILRQISDAPIASRQAALAKGSTTQATAMPSITAIPFVPIRTDSAKAMPSGPPITGMTRDPVTAAGRSTEASPTAVDSHQPQVGKVTAPNVPFAMSQMPPPVAIGQAPAAGIDPSPPAVMGVAAMSDLPVTPTRTGPDAPVPLTDLPTHLPQKLASMVKSNAPTVSVQHHADGSRTTDVELAPADLGRLKLTLQTGEKGLHLTVWVERPEVVDAVRRQLEGLHRALIGEGVTLDSVDIGSRQHRGTSDSAAGAPPAREPEDEAQDQQDIQPIVARRPQAGRLDLSL